MESNKKTLELERKAQVVKEINQNVEVRSMLLKEDVSFEKRAVDAALGEPLHLLEKSPDENWTSEDFLANAKISITGQTSASNSIQETHCKELEDADLKSLSELPKSKREMRWYEKMWAKVKAFFSFIFSFWTVHQKQKEIRVLRDNITLALDHPNRSSIGYDRLAGRPQITSAMLGVEAARREKTKRDMAERGSVGNIRRKQHD